MKLVWFSANSLNFTDLYTQIIKLRLSHLSTKPKNEHGGNKLNCIISGEWAV